ncbi:MAG: aspartate/glutamate racemase family protein [Burkholderiales bacterium]|nr:aspartate/glutamate racemase family protein [Burkholderiales bacterium]
MNQMLFVINPNSTQAVTDHIDRALEPFRIPAGPRIVCATLASGPPGIETQAHVDGISEKLIAYFDAHPEHARADAVVLACFSDPGFHAMRETLAAPVYGSAECAYLTAAAMVDRFGVISILSRAVPRHKRQVRLMGLEHRLAEDLAIEIGVTGLADEEVTFARMQDVGRTLKERHGARAVIMGCAGMARYRARLEQVLDIPVIDPTQAAVAIALGALLARRAGVAAPARRAA